MEMNLEWPQDLRFLLFDDSGPRIYNYIHSFADSILKWTDYLYKQQELDSQQKQQSFEIIKTADLIAGELRFSLSTVDNRIKRKQNSFLPFRRYLTQLDVEEQKKFLSLLLPVLEDADALEHPQEIVFFVTQLTPEIHQSLAFRIQLAEQWEEVIRVLRDRMTDQLLAYANLLAQISMQLQDDSSTQLVRETLSKMDIQFPESPDQPPIPGDAIQLKNRLLECIQVMETTHQQIQVLEEQKRELTGVKNFLVQKQRQIKVLPINKPPTPPRPKPEPNHNSSVVFLKNSLK